MDDWPEMKKKILKLLSIEDVVSSKHTIVDLS